MISLIIFHFIIHQVFVFVCLAFGEYSHQFRMLIELAHIHYSYAIKSAFRARRFAHRFAGRWRPPARPALCTRLPGRIARTKRSRHVGAAVNFNHYHNYGHHDNDYRYYYCCCCWCCCWCCCCCCLSWLGFRSNCSACGGRGRLSETLAPVIGSMPRRRPRNLHAQSSVVDAIEFLGFSFCLQLDCVAIFIPFLPIVPGADCESCWNAAAICRCCCCC